MAEGSGGAETLSALPLWLQIMFTIGTLLAAGVAGAYGILKKRGASAPETVSDGRAVELLTRMVDSNEKILLMMQEQYAESEIDRRVHDRLASLERSRARNSRDERDERPVRRLEHRGEHGDD